MRSLDEHTSMFREAVGCFVVMALVLAGGAGAFVFISTGEVFLSLLAGMSRRPFATL
jgi:hypothetical protein